MQRVKDLANKIPFVVDLTLLLLSNCDFGVYVSFIPANLTSLITVFCLSSLLLVILHCLLNNFAKFVVPPTAEIRLNRQFVKLNRNLAI